MARFISATVSQARTVSCRHRSQAHDRHPPIISTDSAAATGRSWAPSEKACTTADASAIAEQLRRPTVVRGTVHTMC
jgi:hypothetical protein